MSEHLWLPVTIVVATTVAVFSAWTHSGGQQGSLVPLHGATLVYMDKFMDRSLVTAKRKAVILRALEVELDKGEAEAAENDRAAVQPNPAEVALYLMSVHDVPVARCYLFDNEVANVIVDRRQRGKGYCKHLIATVADHRRTLKHTVKIRVKASNAPALACYRTIFSNERLDSSKQIEMDGVRTKSEISRFLVPVTTV
jgi:hypothetical protein